jgi:hypothetical protein
MFGGHVLSFLLGRCFHYFKETEKSVAKTMENAT